MLKHTPGDIRNDGLVRFNEITGRAAEAETTPRTNQAEMQGLTLIFNHDDASDYDKPIFTPARIQAMCEIEGVYVFCHNSFDESDLMHCVTRVICTCAARR